MKRFFVTHIIAGALILSVCVPPPVFVHQAHAQGFLSSAAGDIIGGVLGGGGAADQVGRAVTIVSDASTTGITNTLKNVLSEISSSVIAGVQEQLRVKEFVLDSVAWNLAQEAMNAMTADMLNWINGGADGQTPAFIDNLSEYKDNVALRAAEEFLNGPAIEELNPEHQASVQRALVEHYKQNYQRYEPDINQGLNVSRFEEGIITDWGDFYAYMTTDSNPSRATRNAIKAFDKKLAEAETDALTEADWNDGFLSKKDCKKIEDASGYPTEECTTLTPGAIFRDATSFIVGEQPFLRALEVDEYNEVLSSLFSSLTSEALTGASGLLGLGGNDTYSVQGYGDDSLNTYLEALSTEVASAGPSIALSDINKAIANETRHIEIREEIIDTIQPVVDTIESYRATSTCFDITRTEEEEERYDQLTTTFRESEQELATAQETKAVLEEMRAIMLDGPNGAEQRLVAQQYARLVTEGILHSERDNENLQLGVIEFSLKEAIPNIESSIAAEAARCEGVETPEDDSQEEEGEAGDENQGNGAAAVGV